MDSTEDLEQPGTAELAPPSRHRLDSALSIAGWAYMAVLLWTAGSRSLRIVWPWSISVLLQALTPVLYLPVYLLAPLAAWRRRWAQCAVAVGLIGVHLLSILPAMGGSHLPSWAATGDTLKVLSANVYEHNQESDRAVKALLAEHADVMIVVEITPSFRRAMENAGVDESYPFQVFAPPDPQLVTEAIYSRRPFRDVDEVTVSRAQFESATVGLGSTGLSLTAVHVDSARVDGDEWEAELTQLARVAESTPGPLMLAGDFNATRWNPQFGALLDAGLADAHEARGKGLSFSWPAGAFRVPLMRLDHALVNHHVAVLGVHDFSVPGSDHRAFSVTVAVDPSPVSARLSAVRPAAGHAAAPTASATGWGSRPRHGRGSAATFGPAPG